MNTVPWTEHMILTARRRHLQVEMRQPIVPAYVMEALRQERIERRKAAPTTIVGDASIEEPVAG